MKVTSKQVKGFMPTIKSPFGGNSSPTPVKPFLDLTKKRSDLDEAKELIKHQMRRGLDCPCCGQKVKMYSRSINQTMIKALLIFYKETFGSSDFHHLRDVFKGQDDPTIYRGDFAKLRFWGLVEESNGKWRITKAGVNFLKGWVEVEKYLMIYNGAVEAKSTQTVGILDICKDQKFYDSIMVSTIAV